jgi:hypothetical protein
MAKSDNFFETILAIGALIGGVFVISEILKSLGKKEVVYNCPVCRYEIRFGTNLCPNCHSNLIWPNQKGYEHVRKF